MTSMMTTATDNLQITAPQLETLLAVLDTLTQCYEAHKQALLRKRDILVKSGLPAKDRMTELQAIDRTLLSLNQRAGQLDRERHRVQIEMGCGDWNITQVTTAIREDFSSMARKLKSLQDRLQCALQESTRLNTEIKGLLELSLGWVRETVEIVTTACSPEGASYGAYASKPNRSDIPPPRGLSSTVSHSA